MRKDHRYDLFQNALIEARIATGLTQTDVASRLRKPQSFVSKYESGERRLDVLEFLSVCQALNIKPIYILNKIGVHDDDEENNS